MNMQLKHTIGEKCSCKYCVKVDNMIGDSMLNTKESTFVRNMIEIGWNRNYNTEEKLSIEKIFRKMISSYKKEIKKKKI